MQGGASGQFAAIPLNLAALSKNKLQPTADYVVTGSWSEKAAKEAEKYMNPVKINNPQKPYVTVSDPASWSRNEDAAYLYYCANETVHGVEICEAPETLPGVPLVADVSSNILSRPFDVSKHGIVYGGTQKNLGAAGLTIAIVQKDLIGHEHKMTPSHGIVYGGTQKNLGAAGLTIAIVQKDLIGHEHKMTPSVFSYREMEKNNSVYNTPSTYGIYITKLVLEWIKETGGVHALFERNQRKSSMIYDIINSSDGFYS
uniref:Phosphoserine aminotransferase n=1 Tax=Steinernema glaseri TaxID=37863 RepID=A0A1I7Z849_9BILA